MSAPKPRFYTTEVDASKSAAAIGELVRKYGARQFGMTYDDEGDPASVYFVVPVEDLGEVPVQLEAKVEPITDRLDTRLSRKSRKEHRAQAMRVAWRQMLAYVEMMLEFVENGQRPFHEAFMADVMVYDGTSQRRLADVYRDAGGRLALPSGPSDAIDADYEEVD